MFQIKKNRIYKDGNHFFIWQILVGVHLRIFMEDWKYYVDYRSEQGLIVYRSIF